MLNSPGIALLSHLSVWSLYVLSWQLVVSDIQKFQNLNKTNKNSSRRYEGGSQEKQVYFCAINNIQKSF